MGIESNLKTFPAISGFLSADGQMYNMVYHIYFVDKHYKVSTDNHSQMVCIIFVLEIPHIWG